MVFVIKKTQLKTYLIFQIYNEKFLQNDSEKQEKSSTCESHGVTRFLLSIMNFFSIFHEFFGIKYHTWQVINVLFHSCEQIDSQKCFAFSFSLWAVFVCIYIYNERFNRFGNFPCKLTAMPF